MKKHKSIKLEQALIDMINERAVKENRSFNNMVETILADSFLPEPYFGCIHEYRPVIIGNQDAYEGVCHKCGEKPEITLQSFHGGDVNIST